MVIVATAIDIKNFTVSSSHYFLFQFKSLNKKLEIISNAMIGFVNFEVYNGPTVSKFQPVTIPYLSMYI